MVDLLERMKQAKQEKEVNLTKEEKKDIFKDSMTPSQKVKVRREYEEKKKNVPKKESDVPKFKTEKKQTKKKSNFDFSKHPLIVLLWGEDGSSKSEQIMKFEPKKHTLIFDLEDKLRPLAAKLDFPQENIINAKKYNKKFDADGPATLQGIRDIIDEIKECKISEKGKYADIKMIVFDSISDMRPYAVLEWLEENIERQKPSNPGDWSQINDKVRNICFSLINMGLQTDTHVVFTAQIGYDYDEKKEIPACKPWIWHNIQHKFRCRRDDINQQFYAFCEKSHYDPFFTINLTDWTHEDKPSLLNILQDPELIKKFTQESREEQSKIAKNKLDGIFKK